MKKCTRCGEEKDEDGFYIDRGIKRAECKVCTKLARKRYCKKNPEKIKILQKKYWEKNKTKLLISNNNRYHTNKIEYLAKVRDYREKNREKTRLSSKLWREANPEKRSVMNRNREASKLKAVPPWLLEDEFNQFVIEEAYHLAKLRTETTGIKYHVDHIAPLRSKLVCGLHIWNNLQVIPAIDNIKKGNRVWPDMP